MKLELLLRKLSDFLYFTIIDSGDSIILKKDNMSIRLEGNVLRIETEEGVVEVEEDSVEDFKFFEKTKHCTIRLKNGIMRIYKEDDRFKFFVKLERENDGC